MHMMIVLSYFTLNKFGITRRECIIASSPNQNIYEPKMKRKKKLYNSTLMTPTSIHAKNTFEHSLFKNQTHLQIPKSIQISK